MVEVSKSDADPDLEFKVNADPDASFIMTKMKKKTNANY